MTFSNGLPRYKDIKPHTLQKYIFIGGVLYVISRIAKRPFYFIDFYSGEGKCSCSLPNETRIQYGSPLLILEKFKDEPYIHQFGGAYFNDIDPTVLDSLQYWTKHDFPAFNDRVFFFNNDAENLWGVVCKKFTPNQRIIAIIDPDNISSMVPFSVLQDIANFSTLDKIRDTEFIRRPELIINFMQYGLTRTWEVISSDLLARITGIPLDTIEELRRNTKGKEFADSIFSTYSENIRRLGYQTVVTYNVINPANQSVLYYLVLASNHPSASDLYQRKILSWAETQQISNIILIRAHTKGNKTLDEYQ